MKGKSAVRQLATASPVSSPAMSLLTEKSLILRKSGLAFSSAPTLRSWEQLGKELFAFGDSSQWWIADWLAYGELAFQDRYREAVRKTSLSYQTLRNYVWVARRFELSRRRDNLSFGHHVEVAALDRPEQDFWLRKAEELGWSRNQMRSEVRTSLRERGTRTARTAVTPRADTDRSQPPPPPAAVTQFRAVLDAGGTDGLMATLVLRPTPDRIELWAEAAATLNMQLYDWAIHALNTAARVAEKGCLKHEHAS